MNRTIAQVSDQTIGMAPIECGWDNPNCLGGYSMILGSYDAANERQGSQWFYDVAPPLQPFTGGANYPADETAGDSASPPVGYVVPPIVNVLPSANSGSPVPVPISTPPATTGTSAVAGSGDTVNILGHEISKNVLIGGAVIAAAILLLNGDK